MRRHFAACLAASLPLAAPALAQSYIGPAGVTTSAARAELAALCAGAAIYPESWVWNPATVKPTARSAVSGAPRIEQYRDGARIATYTSFANQPTCGYLGGGRDVETPGPAAAAGCGPFTRAHAYRLAKPGDHFYVYPAVYSGEFNQPWFGPMWDSDADYSAGIVHAPDHVSITGVVIGQRRPAILLDGAAAYNTLGQAPVYFDASVGMTMENIDVLSGPNGYAGKAGIYVAAASDLTLRNMRISGFQASGANGVFGTGDAAGSLTMDGLEIDHNGGPSGPAHNVYIGASRVDPDYAVSFTRSWTHNAFFGHTFKSRAQVNVLAADYFDGEEAADEPHDLGESYLVDIPNGGRLTLRNSILHKERSGYGTNVVSVYFAAEGFTDARPQSADIENNTFIAFDRTDDGLHALTPLAFFWPPIVPGAPGWPANVASRVLKNAFVGYCSPPYLGDFAAVEAFSELTLDFRFTTRLRAPEPAIAAHFPGYTPVFGTPTYQHVARSGAPRRTAAIGARD